MPDSPVSGVGIASERAAPTDLAVLGLPGHVIYAIDPKRILSAAPLTPIGGVDGVGDRVGFMSMASATGVTFDDMPGRKRDDGPGGG
jgi:hypothetical protein